MKKNSFLWAALSMTAALVMTACSNDDNANESPVQQNAAKTIPYTVTVNGGASTRATVESDNKTLYFAAGDKLYVTGTNIKGVLDIQTGTGTASATFSGDLTYSGEGSPAANLELTATLVSAQQTDGSEVTINSTTGAVTVNYPSTAYCADVATAVQKYSNLKGTSTYGAKSFSLTQQTAFLNFVITFEDATTTGTELSAVVSNNSAAICTANVTTTTESEKVVAKFVLPVASTTTLSSATVTMGSKAALNITNATLTGKVYNVTKTQAAAAKTLAEATAGDIGKIAGKDGKIYATKADAEAVATGNAVAMIAYVGTASECAHGLAIALEDVSNEKLTWNNSGNNNESKTAAEWCSAWNTSKAVTGGTWRLPSISDWQYMFIGCGASESYSDNPIQMSYSGLAFKLTTAQGDALPVNEDYWSSTKASPDNPWTVLFGDTYASFDNNTWEGHAFDLVRACLAF